jgi:hypothetical protein
VKRLISKARHPRSKDGHDQLLGDLVRLGPGGGEVLLDSCSGTWLSELAWDKVRQGHQGMQQQLARHAPARRMTHSAAALKGACCVYQQQSDVAGSAHGAAALHSVSIFLILNSLTCVGLVLCSAASLYVAIRFRQGWLLLAPAPM